VGMHLQERVAIKAFSRLEGAAPPSACSEPPALARLRMSLSERVRGVSIGARLAAVVLVTGCLTFGVIGTLASLRLDRGLHEQAMALAALSKLQLAERLQSEADLASARLDMLFAASDRQVQALAQRSDISKIVATQNDVTIREMFAPAARTAELDTLMAVASNGHVIGASVSADLLAIDQALRTSDLEPALHAILQSATRRDRRTFRQTRRVGPTLGLPLDFRNDQVVHTTIEPIFDEFGDVSGALLGIRRLSSVEATLERFVELAHVGVSVITDTGTISSAGGLARTFPYRYSASKTDLIPGDDGRTVARCTPYEAETEVCAFTDASTIQTSQQQMLRIGAQQSESLTRWFLILSAASLFALVASLLISVRHVTRGLPQLSRAAASVAKGDLNVPFAATGVGEVRSLGVAFEAMLANLRSNLEQLKEATRRAEAANAAKSDFLAAMSHEIRTPLNGMLGYTQLLLADQALSAEQRRRLGLVQTSGAALLTVVNDILDFSAIEAGKIELDPRPFNPRTMVDNACSIVAANVKQRGLRLDVQVHHGVPSGVIGDEDRIRQVLLNLLNNAVKFTPSGTVSLTVAPECRPGERFQLRYTVTDTGVGIPADRLGRLFLRFSQVDTSVRREFGGTGLGLAICKQLVELMGGRIGVSSEVGRGSSFWFVAPLDETATNAPLQDPSLNTAPDASGASVLLVEDNSVNQDIARSMLEMMGHTVCVAANGADALNALVGGRFDLILMDIQMPVMDGLEATARIRAMDDPIRRTPIIAMTANVLPQQVEAFRRAGMDDHLGKPFKREHLAAVVERWSGSRSRPNASRASVAA
jgi:signal transduction histidine kinase/ActR/RegA family two-component response regulator